MQLHKTNKAVGKNGRLFDSNEKMNSLNEKYLDRREESIKVVL